MKIIFPILAAILLLCLAPMPYGFYTSVRFVSMVVFAYFGYNYYKKHQEGLMVTFCALALLFQPFFKIALGRTVWNVVDVIVAIGLITLYLIERKKTV